MKAHAYITGSDDWNKVVRPSLYALHIFVGWVEVEAIREQKDVLSDIKRDWRMLGPIVARYKKPLYNERLRLLRRTLEDFDLTVELTNEVIEILINAPGNWDGCYREPIDNPLLNNPPGPGSHLKFWIDEDDHLMLRVYPVAISNGTAIDTSLATTSISIHL